MSAPRPTLPLIGLVLSQCGFDDLDTVGIDTALRNLAEYVTAEGGDHIRRRAFMDAATKMLRAAKADDPAALVLAALGSAGGASPVEFPPCEPCESPVDGAAVLDAVCDVYNTHVVLPPGAVDAMALWVLHTYALDAADVSPILNLQSPTMRCGKTTVLKVTEALVKNGLSASNITPAALFRVIDRYRPTLLVDEADRHPEGLDEILNTGHTRQTARVIRCNVDNEPVSYSTWGAKVVAGIGKRLNTTADRSIPVPMRRMTDAEAKSVRRVRDHRIITDCEPLRSMLARWAKDHIDDLRGSEPPMPAGLNSRAQDNWRPLLAIAERVGGDWPERARRAALQLSGHRDEEDEGVGALLLADLRAIFERAEADWIPTKAILDTLTDMSDRPWGEYQDRKPLSATQLADMLRPFGIRTKQDRADGRVVRGYRRGDFADAWSRYLRGGTLPNAA